jgi:hypothetical protein
MALLLGAYFAKAKQPVVLLTRVNQEGQGQGLPEAITRMVPRRPGPMVILTHFKRYVRRSLSDSTVFSDPFCCVCAIVARVFVFVGVLCACVRLLLSKDETICIPSFDRLELNRLCE